MNFPNAAWFTISTGDKVQGNPELAERIWNTVDSNAAMDIWQMPLSF